VTGSTEATKLRLVPFTVVKDPPTNSDVPSVESVRTVPFVLATNVALSAPVDRSNAARFDRVPTATPDWFRTVPNVPPR